MKDFCSRCFPKQNHQIPKSEAQVLTETAKSVESGCRCTMQNSYDNQEKLARQNSCCTSGNLEYAGFWVRMAAYMIDSVVVFAGLLIVRLIFAGISLAGGGAITGTDILFIIR